MELYLWVLFAYSVFHSHYTDIKRVDIAFRPIKFAKDTKIDSMRIFLGIPVFVAFLTAFSFMSLMEVIIYTLSIRLIVFWLLSFFNIWFPLLKLYTGISFYYSFWGTLLGLVCYFYYFFFI